VGGVPLPPLCGHCVIWAIDHRFFPPFRRLSPLLKLFFFFSGHRRPSFPVPLEEKIFPRCFCCRVRQISPKSSSHFFFSAPKHLLPPSIIYAVAYAVLLIPEYDEEERWRVFFQLCAAVGPLWLPPSPLHFPTRTFGPTLFLGPVPSVIRYCGLFVFLGPLFPFSP